MQPQLLEMDEVDCTGTGYLNSLEESFGSYSINRVMRGDP